MAQCFILLKNNRMAVARVTAQRSKNAHPCCNTASAPGSAYPYTRAHGTLSKQKKNPSENMTGVYLSPHSLARDMCLVPRLILLDTRTFQAQGLGHGRVYK